MPASGGDARVTLEHRAAPRAQSWLFSHKTVNNAADIWDFAPAQPEHISRTCHLLVIGTTILVLSARSCATNQQKQHDRRAPNTPSRRGRNRAFPRELDFVSHKKVPRCACRPRSCTEIRCFCLLFSALKKNSRVKKIGVDDLLTAFRPRDVRGRFATKPHRLNWSKLLRAVPKLVIQPAWHFVSQIEDQGVPPPRC
jgi:hypothetical protein